MLIDSFEKFQQLLVDATQPLAMATMENDRDNFGKSLHVLLFEEEKEQTEGDPSLKRRDDLFIAQLFLDFNEIAR